MRVLAALSFALAAAGPAAAAETHHYTEAQRYAGCLFGEAVPLMRRGMSRERALSSASDRCIAWSTHLSAGDIREVDIEVHRAIEGTERQGL